MANFLIGTVITAGAALIGGTLRPNQVTRQTVERNRQESFNEPKSSYGDFILKVWGSGRVAGILINAKFPPDEEVTVTSSTQQSGGGKGGGGGGQTTITEEKTYQYFGNCAFLLCQEIQQSALKELRLNGKLYLKDGTVNSKYSAQGSNFRFWEGTPTQAIDSYLSLVDSQAIPYRNRAYIVIERLPLEDFGNGYPQASAIIQNGNPNLGQLISDICKLSPDIKDADIDVTDINSISVSGYSLSTAKSPIQILKELAQIYFVDLIDTGAKLRFQKQFRPNSSAFIAYNNLAAHQSGENRNKRYINTIADKTVLPTQIQIKFSDANNNLLDGIERSPIFGSDDNNNITTIDYPGVLSAGEAKTIATQLLWLIWERANLLEIWVSLKYSYLEPGDVIEVQDVDGNINQWQIKQILLGENGVLNLKCWGYRSQVFNFQYTAPSEASKNIVAPAIGGTINLGEVYQVVSVEGYTEGIDYTVNYSDPKNVLLTTITIPQGTNLIIKTTQPESPTNTPLPTPSDTILRVLDIPQVYDGDTKGVYVFGDGDSNWRNASVYVSRDGGNNYSYAGLLITRSTFGTCSTVLGDHSPISQVDTNNSLDILIPNHTELATISEAQFLLGTNRALVGNEIIDFKNAVLLGQSGGNRSYRLSHFNRGLRGTFEAVGSHQSGEAFYLLSGYKLIVSGTQDDIGKTLYFKAITTGQTLNDVDPVTILIQGNVIKAIKPTITAFSPTQGGEGSTVKVLGEKFTGATEVTIGEIPQPFTVDSDTQITLTVTAGTVSGKISVTSPAGVGESTSEFYILTVNGVVQWGEIGGTLSNQTDLQIELNDLRAWAIITGIIF